MRSTIVIEHKAGTYRGTIQGRYGGGYTNAGYGTTPEAAAARAAAEMIRYGQSNPEGASLVAPPDVMALVPEHLREIAPRDTNAALCPHCGGEINPAAMLGQRSSEAKARAARENATKPRPRG